MSLRVMKAGLLTTVQDLGRFGTQKYGVIASGAMDAFAHRTANLLVGNPDAAAALEVTLMGPELLLEQDLLLAITGGDLSPKLNGAPVRLWRTLYAPAGSRLTFGAPRNGCRAYIAFSGGIDVPLVMNSRSTYLRAGIGGWRGRALRAGDELPLGPPSPLGQALRERLYGKLPDKLSGRPEVRKVDSQSVPFAESSWFVADGIRPDYSDKPIIRIMEGEEYPLFDKMTMYRLVHEPFKVMTQSDRMGYRLAGASLGLAEPQEMLSSAVTFGTMQVPPDGNPIVLMADRQTTGGYPRLAQVITVDLPLLAQAAPGTELRFRMVGLAEAQQLLIEREQGLRSLREGLQKAAARSGS